MKIVYTFSEYQAMINTTNAILPEVIEDFPRLTMEEVLAMASCDKRVKIDHVRQEISAEVPERVIIGVSNIFIKHAKPIGAVAKAIKAVAEAMKSLVGGMKDDIEELVNTELAEVEKELDKAA